MIIKLLLIAATLIFGLVLLRTPSGTNLALRRMGGIGIVALGVVAVAFPGTTVWAANLVGVKRGTDLLLYIFVMTFLFSTVASYQRIHRLEQQIAQLTREIALRQTEQGS